MADTIRPFLGRDRAERVVHTTPPQIVNGETGDGAPRQKPLSEKDVQRLVFAGLLEELRRLNDMNTRFADANAGQVLNGVLDVSTVTFDTSGTFTRSYNVTAGSILIVNGANAVTIQSGVTGSAVAPTGGRGIQLVPANAIVPVAIGSHAVTFWGTSAALVSFQTFTGMQAFGLAR